MTSRSFECPMALPVTDRRAPVAAYPSLLTARTHEAEADPTDGIAADSSVIDAERHTTYGHGVESHDSNEDTFGRGGASFSESGEGVPTGSLRDAPGKAALYSEQVRLGRLSRWQEQR